MSGCYNNFSSDFITQFYWEFLSYDSLLNFQKSYENLEGDNYGQIDFLFNLEYVIYTCYMIFYLTGVIASSLNEVTISQFFFTNRTKLIDLKKLMN